MRRRRFIRLLLLLCPVLGLSATAPLHAAPKYTITLLNTFPVPTGTDPSGHDSFAYAINELGVVTGESTIDRTGHIGQTRPVLWNGSSEAVELWDDQTFGGKGLGINSAGFVVGRYGSGSGIPLPGPGIPDGGAFIWNPATRQFMDLGDFGGARAEATGINETNQVSGSAEALEVVVIDGTPTVFPVPRAFVWDAVNGMRDLGTLGGNFSRGTAINTLGEIVGWSALSDGTEHAFLWNPVTGMEDLGALSTGFGSGSRAFGLNDIGQVVGNSQGVGAFIWDRINGIQSLAIAGVPQDINNLGQVIDHVGNIWDQANGMRRLVDLLPSLGEWEISSLSAINDKGQIVGTAFNTVDGRLRGILLAPIPEPDALALLCMGISLWVSWPNRTGNSYTRGT